MAKIAIKYPEYPSTDAYEIDDKTFVVDSLTSHPAIDKVTIHLDYYSGNSGGSVQRVGKLFKVNNKTYADFVINNTSYILDTKTGKIYSAVDFSIETDTPLRILKNIYLSDNSTELNELLSRDKEFRYQMLGRLKSDCEVYLGDGCGNRERLWTKNVRQQIYYMKALFYSFSGQYVPTWINIGYIKELEAKMIQVERGNSK